jgi:hypothetical protein
MNHPIFDMQASSAGTAVSAGRTRLIRNLDINNAFPRIATLPRLDESILNEN